uniref:Uncharacterized protein n=1 Tax=viral metagenome TaxID=1070528 RepID=A0A6C0J8C1_9ZZZZ
MDVSRQILLLIDEFNDLNIKKNEFKAIVAKFNDKQQYIKMLIIGKYFNLENPENFLPSKELRQIENIVKGFVKNLK